MTTMKTLSIAMTGAALVGMGTPAQAFQVFFGEDLGLGENTRLLNHPNADLARDAFFDDLNDLGMILGTEDFESFAPGSGAPLPLQFSSGIIATLQGDGNVANVPFGTNGVGRFPISGNQYWETSDVFSIDFSSPINAFGFYGVDIGDFNGQVTLTLTNGSSETLNIGNTIGGPGGSVLYYGILAQNSSETFTKVTFGNTAAGIDFFGFDDMTIGQLKGVPKGVPEPTSTLALLAFGAFGAGSLLKRKQQQKA